MHKIARQLMASNVVTSTSDSLLVDALHLMRRHGIRHLPVVDNECLVGMLSWDDVMLSAEPTLGGGFLVPRRMVGDVMTRHVITCFPSSEVPDIAATMVACKVDALPVVEGERLVGIVTTTDMLDVLCREDEPRLGRVRPLDQQSFSSHS